MKKVKIGSVGLGRLGYEHARNLATLIPGCELAALCDVAEEQAKKVAEELGVPNVYTDFEEMCKNPELDAIAIVTPSFLHTAQIATAMKYGKHVFCEKPLGTDVAQCKEAEKVIEQYPDLIFQLTSTDTAHRECGYEIPLETSCSISDPTGGGPTRVLINEARWVRGALTFEGDLGGYRQYLINHEVGHAIGYAAHESCPGPGAVAPIMMQQTLSLDNSELHKLNPNEVYPDDGARCAPNPWPYPLG